MSYRVVVKKVAPICVLTMRFLTDAENISTHMREAFAELEAYIKESNSNFGGDCFAIYHGNTLYRDRIEVECCLSFVEPVTESERLGVRTVEGSLMASVLHVGPSEQLPDAYAALMDWIEESDYIPVSGISGVRDVFLDSEKDIPQEERQIEVLWPVRMRDLDDTQTD